MEMGIHYVRIRLPVYLKSLCEVDIYRIARWIFQKVSLWSCVLLSSFSASFRLDRTVVCLDMSMMSSDGLCFRWLGPEGLVWEVMRDEKCDDDENRLH